MKQGQLKQCNKAVIKLILPEVTYMYEHKIINDIDTCA